MKKMISSDYDQTFYLKDKKVGNIEEVFDKLYLDNLYVFLNKYEFFKQLGKYEIFPIQDYGRKSKFKIKTESKVYTLILTDKRIKPYIRKFKELGESFKKIVGYRYLSEDENILVLDYYGDGKGIDIVKLEKNGFYIEDDIYVNQLKNIIDNIHSNKTEFIDLSDNNNYTTWKEYYLDEIKNKINSIYNQKIITNNIYKLLLDKLYNSATELDSRESCLIHADITPLNVCINIETKQLYLIDYDDFKIGDSLMDISRIINCKNMSKIFNKLVELYYKNYEDNINHLFYTLRIHVNWYNHIIEHNQEKIYDLENAKTNILEVIGKIFFPKNT